MALTSEGLLPVPGLASRWVRLASGARAHYVTAGDDGPAVVLLHGGLPGSSGTAGWRFMAPHLADRGFRVYAPDMPAYGLSDPREQYWPRGVHDHVDFLHEFVTALCLERFHLAGNSMGTINSVSYLVAHPERVVSFALVAGSVGDLLPPERIVAGTAAVPPYDGTRESMRTLMSTIIANGEAVTDDLLDMRWQSAVRNDAAWTGFFRSLSQFGGGIPYDAPAIAARLSTKGRLDRIGIPGVYLYGRDDILSPVENGYAQEDVLPDVQFFYPEDCGHQGQTDRPDVFNPVFEEFFRNGLVSRRTADAAGVSRRRPELPLVAPQ